jgi:hypothetical protein
MHLCCEGSDQPPVSGTKSRQKNIASAERYSFPISLPVAKATRDYSSLMRAAGCERSHATKNKLLSVYCHVKPDFVRQEGALNIVAAIGK